MWARHFFVLVLGQIRTKQGMLFRQGYWVPLERRGKEGAKHLAPVCRIEWNEETPSRLAKQLRGFRVRALDAIDDNAGVVP
jgi:hypothetical protein